MPRMPKDCPDNVVVYYVNSGNNVQQDLKIKALEKRLDEAVEKLSDDIASKIVETTMGEDFVVNADVGHVKHDMQVSRTENVRDLLRQILRNDDFDNEVDLYFYDGEVPPEDAE